MAIETGSALLKQTTVAAAELVTHELDVDKPTSVEIETPDGGEELVAFPGQGVGARQGLLRPLALEPTYFENAATARRLDRIRSGLTFIDLVHTREKQEAA